MSKRYASIKRSLALTSLGGSLFTFLFAGNFLGDALPGFGCDMNLQNADLVAYDQAVGDAMINSAVTSTFGTLRGAGIIGGDFQAWYEAPTNNLFQAMWNNAVFLQYPLDPGGAVAVRQ